MSSKVINKFSSIVEGVPTGTLLNQVSITLSSEYVQPDLETIGSPYISNLEGTTLTLIPDTMWLEGIEIEINCPNLPTIKYIVPYNRYIYAPEQRLYSLDNLGQTDNLPKLLNLGLITTFEKSLLDSMGPKLEDLMLKVSKCLVTVFIYNTPTTVKDCTTLVGFRRMLQIMHMFGLDSIVEYILNSPGPEREWFRRANIQSPLSDTEVFEKYLAIEKEVLALENTMKAKSLNTDFIHTIDLQVDPKLPWNSVLKGIVTLFCALRYTHDNSKFSY